MAEEQPRQSERRNLSCEVEFRRRGDVAYRVDLINLSPEGCHISAPVMLQADDDVWLRIPNMEAIPGKVVWAKDWDVGVLFEKPFHPAVLDMVIARLTP